MFTLLREFRDEAGIRQATQDNPAAINKLIDAEIALHEPLIKRDHSSRVYIDMLRRIKGDTGSDPHAEHAKMMRSALDALKRGEEA